MADKVSTLEKLFQTEAEIAFLFEDEGLSDVEIEGARFLLDMDPSLDTIGPDMTPTMSSIPYGHDDFALQTPEIELASTKPPSIASSRLLNYNPNNPPNAAPSSAGGLRAGTPVYERGSLVRTLTNFWLTGLTQQTLTETPL